MDLLSIINALIILSIIDKLLISIKPTLEFKSNSVIVLFKKSNVNNLICVSLVNEFKRVQDLFSHIPRNELDFIEIDCSKEPSKCIRFQVYGVPQIHAYTLKKFQNQLSKINSTVNNHDFQSPSCKDNEDRNDKNSNLISKEKIKISFYNFIRLLNKIFPISFLDYYTNIFNREKIIVMNNTAEKVAFFISNISFGTLFPNTKKYTLTPERSPRQISRLIFHKYKCSISTFYQHIIPMNVRGFYDDILLNETFKKKFSLSNQLETSFVNALLYRTEIKERYNISRFPMIAFEYMGSRNIVNTSISIEYMKKVLKHTCRSSSLPSPFPNKRRKK
ncbi:hypothetical protein M9Y10_009809 [Tritrichomonas musculus]|uniref:Uncharacterized protein n=1 Tax=Tritrichomonas musculus TaxID=1915356 RepID=A0ABR2IPK0_9EUKA